jgi:flagella basal body P-ring formation protein FlgA
MSSDRVPAGQIEFPLSGLGTPSPTGPSAPVLWRGDVVYGDSHRFAIWARVEIAAPCRRLTAGESLKAGRPLEARQIRVTTGYLLSDRRQGAPDGRGSDRDVADSFRSPPAASCGSSCLAPPNEINRGDAVHIEVRSGAARLVLTARALNGGRSGDTISVRNPDSNKTFQARVTGKGTAIVEAGHSERDLRCVFRYRSWSLTMAALLLATPAVFAGKKPRNPPEPSALDKYLQEALKQPVAPVQPSAGSLWSSASRLTDIGSDVRAAQVDDLVTIVVNESASAVATGATQTSRALSAIQFQITALLAPKSPGGALQNLLNTPARRP